MQAHSAPTRAGPLIQVNPSYRRTTTVEALVRNVRGSMERAASLGKNISPEVLAIIANLDDAGRLADLAASNLELKVEDAQTEQGNGARFRKWIASWRNRCRSGHWRFLAGSQNR